MIARWLITVACLMVYLTINTALLAAEPSSPRVIGIEGKVQITLDRGDYQPKPLDDRTPLILRVEAVKAASDGKYTYDFHYIGFEPGSYKLAEYLIHPDGTPATEMGEIPVNIRSILPPDHDGALNDYLRRPFPWFGGYRMMLVGLAALWMTGLLVFIWLGRRKKRVMIEETLPPTPSYAERMRPLVEAAAAGNLTLSGQAELERLMLGYWREKLALSGQRMADNLAALKRHPEAGLLLRALERWLHKSGGASPEEINSLLGPYRQLTASRGKELGA
jgi:hypothetical protein